MKPWDHHEIIVRGFSVDEDGDPCDDQKVYIKYMISFGQSNKSLLYKALVDLDIAKDASMAFSQLLYNPTITVNVTGFEEEKRLEIEQIIFDVFKKFSEDTSEKIEKKINKKMNAIYHSNKLWSMDVIADFGFILLKCCIDQWIFGANPLNLIDWDTNLDRSLKDCCAKGYLQSLAKKYLADNKHIVIQRQNFV